jgi:hypothetical protein
MKIHSYLGSLIFLFIFTFFLVSEADAGWEGYNQSYDDGTRSEIWTNGEYIVVTLYNADGSQGMNVLQMEKITDVTDAADLVADAIAQAAGTDNPNPEDPSGGAGSSDPRPGTVREILKGVSKPILTMTFEESPAGKKIVRIIPALDPVYIPSPTGDDQRPKKDALGGASGQGAPKLGVDLSEDTEKILNHLAKNADELIDPNGGSVRDQLASLIGAVDGGTVELIPPKDIGPGPSDPGEENIPKRKSDDENEQKVDDPWDGLPGPPELVNPNPTATARSPGAGSASLDAQMGALPDLLKNAPTPGLPTTGTALTPELTPAASNRPTRVPSAQAGTNATTDLSTVQKLAPSAPTIAPQGQSRATTLPQAQPRAPTTVVPRLPAKNLKETLK